MTDSCQNKPLDFIDIKTNHGIEMNKKIMKPQLVHIKLKNFSFELSKRKPKVKL